MVEAVCAEPVIRCLAEQSDRQAVLTVCQKHADLYAGHPAVKCVIYDEEEACNHSFDTTLRLPEPAEFLTFDNQVQTYAEQMKIRLKHHRPKITLAGYDLIRAQRFGACTLKRPRIAVAINPTPGPEQNIQWRRFCESLLNHSDCSVIVLGETNTELPASKNLSGRLTSRESAAVLSQCDILVTTEESFAALGLAVGVESVVIGSDEADRQKDEFTDIARIREFSPELILSAMRQRSTPVQ